MAVAVRMRRSRALLAVSLSAGLVGCGSSSSAGPGGSGGSGGSGADAAPPDDAAADTGADSEADAGPYAYKKGCDFYASDFGGSIAEQAFGNRAPMELLFVRPLLHLWQGSGPSKNYVRQVATPAYLADGFVAASCNPREPLPAPAGVKWMTFVDATTPAVEVSDETCSTTYFSTIGAQDPVLLAEHTYPGKTLAELGLVRVIAHRSQPLVSDTAVEYADELPRLVYLRDGAVALKCGSPGVEPIFDKVTFVRPTSAVAPDVVTLPCDGYYAEQGYPGKTLDELAHLRAIGHWDKPFVTTVQGGSDGYSDYVLGYVLVRDEYATSVCITESAAGSPSSITYVWQDP